MSNLVNLVMATVLQLIAPGSNQPAETTSIRPMDSIEQVQQLNTATVPTIRWEDGEC